MCILLAWVIIAILVSMAVGYVISFGKKDQEGRTDHVTLKKRKVKK